jgi:hypothetical protein
MKNPENARIWLGADAYTAPYGADAPEDVESEWGVEWAGMGILAEEDISEEDSTSATDHYGYGGIHIRTTRSKSKRTIKVVCAESNPTVWALANPGSEAVTVGGVTTRSYRDRTAPDVRAFGLELRDGDIVTRMVIPRGEVESVGGRTLNAEKIDTTELTIVIYPDSNGVLYHEITNDPGVAVVTSS